MKPGFEFRTWTRHPIDGACTLDIAGRTLSVDLQNVSLGGALVKSDELPESGASVALTLPHGARIQGTVVRRTGEGFALRFDPDEAKAIGVNDEITFALNRDLLGIPAA